MNSLDYDNLNFKITPEATSFLSKNITNNHTFVDRARLQLNAIRASLLYKYPEQEKDFISNRTNCLGATTVFDTTTLTEVKSSVGILDRLPWHHPDRKIGVHLVNIFKADNKFYFADPTPVAGYMHGQLEEISKLTNETYRYKDKNLSTDLNITVLSKEEIDAIKKVMILRTRYPNLPLESAKELTETLPKLKKVLSYYTIACILIDKISNSKTHIRKVPIEAIPVSKAVYVTDLYKKKLLAQLEDYEHNQKLLLIEQIKDSLRKTNNIYRQNYLLSIINGMKFKKPTIDYEKFFYSNKPIQNYEKYMLTNHLGQCASNLYEDAHTNEY